LHHLGRWRYGIPKGVKPLLVSIGERPKAEALGYLEAKATTRAYPFGMNGKRSEGKSKGKSRSSAFGEGRQLKTKAKMRDQYWP
jgi:hypothetical protein